MREAPAERVVVHRRDWEPAVPAPTAKGPPRNHAARGHERDDEYMADFDAAYKELEAAARGGGGAPRAALADRAASGRALAPAGPRPVVVSDTSVSLLRVATLGRQWYRGPIVPEGVLRILEAAC